MTGSYCSLQEILIMSYLPVSYKRRRWPEKFTRRRRAASLIKKETFGARFRNRPLLGFAFRNNTGKMWPRIEPTPTFETKFHTSAASVLNSGQSDRKRNYANVQHRTSNIERRMNVSCLFLKRFRETIPSFVTRHSILVRLWRILRFACYKIDKAQRLSIFDVRCWTFDVQGL
jgi:hypothetical protein